MMIKVGVVYGGRSGEHNVSLCSAASVVSSLDREKYEIVPIGVDRDGKWHVQDKVEIVKDDDFGNVLKINKTGTWLVNHYEDDNKLYLHEIENNRTVDVELIFPVVHGTFCEDGTLQGLLELAMVPYVGADVIGSSVGMDKDVCKRILRDAGIPVVPWLTVSKEQWENNQDEVISRTISELNLPVFIKPSNAGSSVGIRKVKDSKKIKEAVKFAFLYDNKILIERAIDCREIECSVIGNELPEASVLGEIIPGHEFYSYEAKYIDPDGAELKIPAELDEAAAGKMRRTAVEAYKSLCCSSMARIDFFLEKGSSVYYLNEINTIPGFTGVSMYPKLWEASGLGYGELLDRLIEFAIERHKNRLRINTEL